MVDQTLNTLLQSISSPLKAGIQQHRQILTDGMGSYIADYLRPQTTAKLLSNLMQSRRQGIWTSRDNGITKYVTTQFNGNVPINEFGTFIDSNGVLQMIFANGSHLTWYNVATTVPTNLTTSMPTDHTNNGDPLYPLFPCIRQHSAIIAGILPHAIVTHPQWVEPYTVDSSGTFAVFQLNASAGSGYWGTLTTPIVSTTTVYGYPALCEPFLDRMVYAGWPISFQTNPPGGLGSPTVYDILVTNSGTYNTVTQSSTLLATDGVRLQVPAICGRPTSIKTIQISNNTNAQAVIIGCQRGVCLIQGTDATNMGLVILTLEFGIPSNRAILQIQNDIIFLANDGIRTYSALVINANLLTSALSYGLQDYVQTWDQTWLNQAFAVRHRVTKDIQFWMPQLNANGSSNGAITVGNSGAVFNGTNQYLSHASNSSLQIPTAGSFTWAAWVNFSNLSGAPNVLSKTTDEFITGDYALYYSAANNAMEFVTFDGTHANAGGVLATNFGPLSVNMWYFVLAWYDASTNMLNISINNGAPNSAVASFAPVASSAEFDIATYDGGAGGFLDGIVRSVGYWKRILSSAEMLALYNAGSPLSYAQLSPALQAESITTFVSYWNLNESSGTRNDSRSTANNLTQHNTVGTTTGVSVYMPAPNNLAFVMNYGDSSPDVQAIPQLAFTPSIRQGLTQAAAIEFQDPNNQNIWTMFGGGYNGYLYTHYSGNTNDGMSLPWAAIFPLVNNGNDATGFNVDRIHVITEGVANQNYLANFAFFSIMTNGAMQKVNAQQQEFNIISGSASETILGQWKLGQSAFPGTYPQLSEYEPTGEGRFGELQLSGAAANNVIDLIGAHFLLEGGGTKT